MSVFATHWAFNFCRRFKDSERLPEHHVSLSSMALKLHSIRKVNNFYEYWVNFESWRDFSLQGEHDVEDAHDRYEKRWMIKENDRKSKVCRRTWCLSARASIPRLACIGYWNALVR